MLKFCFGGNFSCAETCTKSLCFSKIERRTYCRCFIMPFSATAFANLLCFHTADSIPFKFQALWIQPSLLRWFVWIFSRNQLQFQSGLKFSFIWFAWLSRCSSRSGQMSRLLIVTLFVVSVVSVESAGWSCDAMESAWRSLNTWYTTHSRKAASKFQVFRRYIGGGIKPPSPVPSHLCSVGRRADPTRCKNF
jgi:hypothetical protein